MRLEGAPDRERLYQAFNKLIERHSILRTSFLLAGDEPVQHISDKVNFTLDYFSSEGKDPASVIAANIRPFDLAEAPLLRVVLIAISAHDHLLMVDMHHMVTDGVSYGILIQDFIALYNHTALPELKLQYKDFAVWQQSPEQQERISRQKDFWLRIFPEVPPVPDLPADFARPPKKTDQGSSFRFDIRGQEMERLRSIAAEEGVSMFTLILSFLNILIAKLSNQDDIVIGVNTAGRQHADLENMIGLFVNTLALRNFPREDLTFKEFLSELQARTLASFDNQEYPFEALIDELKMEPDRSRNPLFEVLMVYQNFHEPAFVIPGLKLLPYEGQDTKTKFDLSLVAFAADDHLLLTFEYSTALFRKDTIEGLAGYFKNIIASIAEDTHKRIGDI
jgi:hypothetical protein